jgi:hypothetical protein
MMGIRSDARKLPPLPWTWAAEREHMLYLFDASGKKIGAFWGDAKSTYAAAKFVEWLTVRYGNPLLAEFERLGIASDAYMKADRDERARLRGIRMRKLRQETHP